MSSGSDQGTREGVHGTDVGLRGAGADDNADAQAGENRPCFRNDLPALISSSVCAGAATSKSNGSPALVRRTPNGHIRGDTEPSSVRAQLLHHRR